MTKARIGYVGKEDMPVGAAFAGIVHLERTPGGFTSLCGQRLSMAIEKDKLLHDRGYIIPQDGLHICKRCQARAVIEEAQ